jgi:hypothetical protein
LIRFFTAQVYEARSAGVRKRVPFSVPALVAGDILPVGMLMWKPALPKSELITSAYANVDVALP